MLSMALLTLFGRLQAQDEPAISSILERGPHHRVVEFTRTLIDTNGIPYTHLGRYTEIGNGLHYLSGGEWIESEEIVEPHPLGAVAQRGLYRVLFHANLNRRGAIEIEMPDGRTLRNHPLGIYITDASAGRSVLVGQLKDSIGVLLPPNEVLYSDAFEGIQADMMYRYQKGSFEASVILREQPLLPRDFNPTTTMIELATEFLEPPERIIGRPPPTFEGESTVSAVESVDHLVDFGDMQMMQGRAFSADSADADAETTGVPVEKHWLVVEGRQVLFERVWLPEIAPLIEALPVQRYSLPDQVAVEGRPIPPQAVAIPEQAEPMLLAGGPSKSPGLVLDYTLVISYGNWTFMSGPTYVVNNWVTCSYKTHIHNGAIIKFAPDSGMTITGRLLSPGDWGSRAILTSKDDDSVGEPVGSGNPPAQQNHTALKLYYAQPVADLYYGYPGKVQRLEIRYASKGVHDYSPGANHTVYNCRFRQCDVGVVADNTTVTIDDVIMCEGMPYQHDWYELIPSGAVVVGADDITTDCNGWGAPLIELQPVGGAVSAGSYKQFIVGASGKCLLYQWYHNGVGIPGANSWSFPIQQVQLSHAGVYHVEVRNDTAFVRSDRVTLTVNNSPPQIYQQPFSQKIRTGGTVRFAVGAAGPGLAYQWYRGDVLLSGKTAYDVVLTSVNSGHAGNYTVRVSNSYGNLVSQVATLTVVSAGTSVTYTNNQDFANGILINLNYTTAANQLQINTDPTPLPFVNVPCSYRGTLARIDANTGRVLGEYATAASATSDPSRTAVDRNGNVWVANRNAASVTKFGVIIGGIRGNKKLDGTLDPDPDGRYLGPPFIYNTCRDRHGTAVGDVPDGLIKTSRRLADIYPWVLHNGVYKPEDEAVLFKVDWTGKKPRTLAVDKDDNVWVGGGSEYSEASQPHQKFDGFTGTTIGSGFDRPGYGGYGGFIDGAGYLWSAGGGGLASPGLLRANVNSVPYSFSELGNSHGNYGIAIDPRTQRVWYGLRGNPPQSGQLGVYNANGALLADYYYPSPYPRGIVIDFGYNVWVADSAGANPLGKHVTHLRTDGTVVGNVDLMFVPPDGAEPEFNGCEPTGLAVDTNRKVWVVNRHTSTAMRIDPNAGPEGAGTYRIGAVDLTVDLGDGSQHTGAWQYPAMPYAYSDMTGFVTLGTTFPSGSWIFVHDEGTVNRVWNKIAWTGFTPSGTGIQVEVRASNTLTQLPNLSFTTVMNDQQISNVTGRYLEIRVTLHRQPLIAETPVLYDLTVKTP
jgi:hypothetical protein